MLTAKGVYMLKKAAQWFGYILLLIGILGFIPGVTTEGMLLGILHVNAVHNVIHLLTGAVFVYAGMADDVKTARMAFQVFGVVYALIAVLGFVSGDNPILGIVSSNMPDTWLHVVIAVVALYFGFGTKAE